MQVLISLLYFVGLNNGILALVVGLPIFIAIVALLIDGLMHLPGQATWLHQAATVKTEISFVSKRVCCVEVTSVSAAHLHLEFFLRA